LSKNEGWASSHLTQEVKAVTVQAESPHQDGNRRATRSADRTLVGIASKLPVVVFGHSNLGQFRALHEYLMRSGRADSYLICSQANWRNHRASIPNLVPFTPHGGVLKNDDSFYYLTKLEEVNRRSLGIAKALADLSQKVPIDCYIGHVSAGSPSLFFDRFSFPILTYLEFPSFKHHGWDAKYPPPESKQIRDSNFEMLTHFAVMKSVHSIVPSEYARSLFPQELQGRITALMEGFCWDAVDREEGESLDGASLEVGSGCFRRAANVKYVGFAARDLSSAKGFQHFVQMAKRIGELRSDVEFVVLGSPELLYSYENHFLDGKYGTGHGQTFADWVLEEEGVDRQRFHFLGKLPYGEFGRVVRLVDIFLYPLQFGSANWGLFELLGRSRVVIASHRCFVPEVIKHEDNGLMLSLDCLDDWVATTLRVLNQPETFAALGLRARKTAHEYSIEKVADRFLELLSPYTSRSD